MLVARGAHHAAVPVPQAVEVQVVRVSGPRAQGGKRADELRVADLAQATLRLGRIQVGVVDLAFLAAGADHEVHSAPLGQRLGDHPTGREHLVVRVGVDQQQAPGFVAHAGRSARMAASYPRLRGVSMAPNRTQFTSHSMGLIITSGTIRIVGRVTASARSAV